MFAKVQQKDPALVAHVMDLVEAGCDPEEIAAKLVEANEKANIPGEPEEEETFPPEILMVAQALAWRGPSVGDSEEIASLLSDAYWAEVSGPEAFRAPALSQNGEESGKLIPVSLIRDMIESADFHWVICEAPDGHGVEEDGIILGVCCYTADGLSRCNGKVEGPLGSIRFFGVPRRYHGVTIGQRLLYRVERAMVERGCVRVMACVASTRASITAWLQRRGFLLAGGYPYPADPLGHRLLADHQDEELVRLLKKLPAKDQDRAAGKNEEEEMYSKMVQLTPQSEAKTEAASAEVPNPNPTEAPARAPTEALSRPPVPPPQIPGKMNLPPAWRAAAASAAATAAPGATAMKTDTVSSDTRKKK